MSARMSRACEAPVPDRMSRARAGPNDGIEIFGQYANVVNGELGPMEVQEIVGILLSLTAICSYLNYKFLKLPKSIGITLVALLITIFIVISGLFGWGIHDFAAIVVNDIGFDDTFLHGMLSFLLFAGALHINPKDLAQQKGLIFSFATISVIISTLLIGFATYGITQTFGVELPLYYCFVFGALISPTDAIAVLGVLAQAKVPKSLETKITGEALFNDAMGIVLFFIAIGFATGQHTSLDPNQTIIYFLREGGGGLLYGLIVGWCAVKILDRIDDYELAIILTLALVTGGYSAAVSLLDVSGPIFMVITGLVIGSFLKHNRSSKISIQNVELFWDLLDQLLNAILFVLIGLEFMRIHFEIHLILASMAVVVASIGARWVSICVPVVMMARFKTFNSSVIAIMTWCGLRGGISIALALGISGPYHDTIVTITYFVVLFSIMIQGITMGPLINNLTKKKAFE